MIYPGDRSVKNLRMQIIGLPKDPCFVVNRAEAEKHLTLINRMNNQGLGIVRRSL